VLQNVVRSDDDAIAEPVSALTVGDGAWVQRVKSVPLRILSSRLSAADQALRDARLSELRCGLPGLLTAAYSTYQGIDVAQREFVASFWTPDQVPAPFE
jgi:hypothetical protein